MEAPNPIAGSAGERRVFEESFRARIQHARDAATAALWGKKEPGAGWTGELSSSALSTATAVTALTLVARGDRAAADRLRDSIQRGYAWLIGHQNGNGGWGDTTRSISNISTTALVWAALRLCPDEVAGSVESAGLAERWLARTAGSVEPDRLVEAIERRYGPDRTFSIPILTMCALCGRLGSARDGWRRVRQLPFELAALPQAWFGAMRLPVVSYALPALIAIGQVRHGRRPTANPLLRWMRNRCRARTLRKLAELQPAHGGFLEATPLTSFVTMSLAALGHHQHPVVQRGVAFLENSRRADGSWPIDTNLATWLTTLSVNALVRDGSPGGPAPAERHGLRDWLLDQQYRHAHAYTLAAPGGWAWTNLPGGVPDADDTAGAILALLRLDPGAQGVHRAVEAGVTWLLDLQNGDGGIPTFCRGWGRLPFDRSSPDLTAHAVRAWLAAREVLPPRLGGRVQVALKRAMSFLLRTQRVEGTWIPLWFGNQHHPADENPVYGTTRVILALADLEESGAPGIPEAIQRALNWIMRSQNADGGWGGTARAESAGAESPGVESSLEETGLALEALASVYRGTLVEPAERPRLHAAVCHGACWLAGAIERRQWDAPVPIGLYFAKLWYFERLYPLVFANAALTQLVACLEVIAADPAPGR